MLEHDVDRIDLLKIDAEGAEMPRSGRHPCVRLAAHPADSAVEAHGEDCAERVRVFLEGKGYRLSVDPPDLIGFQMLYARR